MSMTNAVKSLEYTENLYIWLKHQATVNPFVPNAPFIYPLKTLENRKVV